MPNRSNSLTFDIPESYAASPYTVFENVDLISASYTKHKFGNFVNPKYIWAPSEMEKSIGFQNGKTVEQSRFGEQDTESSSFKAPDLLPTPGMTSLL
jgi:hypothetical protein